MNHMMVYLLIVLLLWKVCHMQSAAFRIVKSLDDSSVPIHHALNIVLSTETMDYISQIETSANERLKLDTTTESQTVIGDINQEYSEEFASCPHASLEKREYEKLSNKSVYVPLYEKVFNVTDYIIYPNGTLYICSVFWNEHYDYTKFPKNLGLLSVIGTAISSVCIVLYIVMFLLFEKLRNLSGYCLFSLCKALLTAYLFTIIHSLRNDNSDCTAIGIIKQYAFLASFFWMNVMSYDIWRSLRLATEKLQLIRDRPILTRFAMYSSYSWGTPLLIVIAGLIVNSTDTSNFRYKLIIETQACWFAYRQALFVYFALPLFVLLFLNILLFVFSFLMISRGSMNNAENKADLWFRFMVSMRLAVVMGLMWIFGVLATATEAEWMWYLNVICNALQGVFIFFSFAFTDKVKNECRKFIKRKKSSVAPIYISTSV